MTLATINAYNLSLFLHISAVVVGFGATFAEAIMLPVALKLDKRHLPYVYKLQLAINQYLATPALVIVLATGIFQAIDADWDMGAFWISASFAIVIALGGLIGAYFIPTDRRLLATVQRELAAATGADVELSEDYQRQARREGLFGTLTGILILLAVFLMVTKPGA